MSQPKKFTPKSIMKSVKYYVKKAIRHNKSIFEIHKYWEEPYDNGNKPESYLKEKIIQRSLFLVNLINKYENNKQSHILEIGCNAGRNLNYLYNSGYVNLEAIEISKKAVETLNQIFPMMANQITIYNFPVEEIIKKLKSKHYDVVFTMAVLEHIHPESEWIFNEMVRITNKLLITVEDEKGLSWRHFPRNYKKIFESSSMKQIDEIFNLNEYGLGGSFVARVFAKFYYT